MMGIYVSIGSGNVCKKVECGDSSKPGNGLENIEMNWLLTSDMSCCFNTLSTFKQRWKVSILVWYSRCAYLLSSALING